MKSLLKTNVTARNALILYEIIQNKERESKKKRSIWQAFESFTKVLGNDFMDFQLFEHLYLKLENGEKCDLDYDGRPEYNRQLCDMPEDTILLIADKITALEKWILRETSLSLRQMIDPCFPIFNKLTIELTDSCDSYEVVTPVVRGKIFFQSDSDVLCIEYIENATKESKVVKTEKGFMLENYCENVMEAMFRDIRIIVEDLKTELTHFDLKMRWDDILNEKSFFEHLKSFLRNQDNVQEVTIRSNDQSHFYPIFSHLKPKTLQSINLHCNEPIENFSEIRKLDQWRQAKVVYSRFPNEIPLRDVMHLEEFRGCKNILTAEELLKMKNELTRIETMKVFGIKSLYPMENIQTLNVQLGPLNPEFQDTMNRRHFRIVNSEKLMRLRICRYRIEFTLEETVNLSDEWDRSDEDDDEYD